METSEEVPSLQVRSTDPPKNHQILALKTSRLIQGFSSWILPANETSMEISGPRLFPRGFPIGVPMILLWHCIGFSHSSHMFRNTSPCFSHDLPCDFWIDGTTGMHSQECGCKCGESIATLGVFFIVAAAAFWIAPWRFWMGRGLFEKWLNELMVDITN